MSAAELPRRRPTLRVVSGVLLLAGCEGCIMHSCCVHDPPLAKSVPKIVRGQTTRAQILAYFGVPDLEAQGSTVTLHDDSAMGRQRQKLKRTLERLETRAERFNTKGHVRQTSGTGWIDEWARLRAYSSIDEDHVAYLYEEVDERVIAGMTFGLPVAIGGGDYRALRNRLLVLINKNTGMVDEFGYRQEFSAP